MICALFLNFSALSYFPISQEPVSIIIIIIIIWTIYTAPYAQR